MSPLQWLIIWSAVDGDGIGESPIFNSEAEARLFLEGGWHEASCPLNQNHMPPEDAGTVVHCTCGSFSDECAQSKAYLICGYDLKTEDRT